MKASMEPSTFHGEQNNSDCTIINRNSSAVAVGIKSLWKPFNLFFLGHSGVWCLHFQSFIWLRYEKSVIARGDDAFAFLFIYLFIVIFNNEYMGPLFVITMNDCLSLQWLRCEKQPRCTFE